MRVYVIDPNDRTIREDEITWAPGDYGGLNAGVYRLGRFDCYDRLRITETDYVHLDDEGLHKPLVRWSWAGYPRPLAGIGVVVGTHGEESCAPSCSLLFLRAHVLWGVF